MDNEFGGDFVSITDEEGNEFELELLDVLELDGVFYHAFVPATQDEVEDDDLEIVILKSVEDDDEELLSTLDSEEEIEKVYGLFIERLLEDDGE